jgi:hypothetical protein
VGVAVGVAGLILFGHGHDHAHGYDQLLDSYD